MGVQARNAVYASNVDGMERLILLILADFSPSQHSPFEAWPGVQKIMYCAHLGRAQTYRYLASLKARGVVESYEINRYRRGYRILLPDADVSSDDTPQFSGVASSDTPHAPDVSSDDTPQFSGVASSDTPEYPYGVSSDETRGVSSTSSGVSSTSSGVSSTSLLIRNEREERIERKENENARTRDPIPPASSIMTADQTYNVLLTYLDGEVSQHELKSWKHRVRPGWSAPDVLCLRGPASLVRLPRFTGCMRMAAKQVGVHAVITFSAIG